MVRFLKIIIHGKHAEYLVALGALHDFPIEQSDLARGSHEDQVANLDREPADACRPEHQANGDRSRAVADEVDDELGFLLL